MKKLLSLFMVMFVFIFIFHVKMTAFAQDAAEVAQPAAVSQPANPGPSGGEKAVAVLKDVDSKIPLSIPPWVLGSLVFVAEAIVRVVPTAKPKSFLLLIAAGFGLLGSIFSKLSGLFDVVVQNTKDDPKLP